MICNEILLKNDLYSYKYLACDAYKYIFLCEEKKMKCQKCWLLSRMPALFAQPFIVTVLHLNISMYPSRHASIPPCSSFNFSVRGTFRIENRFQSSMLFVYQMHTLIKLFSRTKFLSLSVSIITFCCFRIQFLDLECVTNFTFLSGTGLNCE